jgi:hypothetical protein
MGSRTRHHDGPPRARVDPNRGPMRHSRNAIALLSFGTFALFVGPLGGEAHAELSDGAASRAWNIEHGLYSDKCDPAKPIPARVDDQDVSRCENAVEREATELARFSEAEKKEPRVTALFALHAKLTAHAAKVKAAYDAIEKQAADADRNYQAFYKEAQDASLGLYFLSSLEEHSASASSMRASAEARVTSAQSLTGFVARCKSTYAALKPKFKKEGLEGDPVAACAVASRGPTTLRQEVPALFVKMRAQNAETSKELRDKIEEGRFVFAGNLPCAQDPKKCGTEEAQIARVATALGIPAGAPPAPADAAFQAATKKATSVLRMGKAHDPAREAVMKAALKAAKVPFTAVALTSTSDEIRKNDMGFPLSKVREGHFLVKMPNESFCRSYDITVASTYQGGGRYGAFVADDPKIDDGNVKFMISSCK